MAKRTVEVTHEDTETVTETVEIIICDLCSREVGNGGRRYFGFQEEEVTSDGPTSDALMVNSFVTCGKCNERFK